MAEEVPYARKDHLAKAYVPAGRSVPPVICGTSRDSYPCQYTAIGEGSSKYKSTSCLVGFMFWGKGSEKVTLNSNPPAALQV